MSPHVTQDALSSSEGGRPRTMHHGERAAYAATAAHAQALADTGREDEAYLVCKEIAAAHPQSGSAHHNCAVMAERCGDFPAAVELARQAMALGTNGSETLALLARALQGAGEYRDATLAYCQAIRCNPLDGAVHRDLAQLIWMRTEDIDAATAQLRQTLRDYPDSPQLVAQLAKALSFGKRDQEAYLLLVDTIARASIADPVLHISASVVARALGRPREALDHAQAAVSTASGNPAAVLAFCDAHLMLGNYSQVAPILERLHLRLPNAQQVTARLATTWRLLNDPRYRKLYNYANLIRIYELPVPDGWLDLPTFLTDLAEALQRSHTMRAHPFDQSVRNGTQTYSNLHRSRTPEIHAFFAAATACVGQYVEMLKAIPSPLASRNTGRFRILDSWSVAQRSGGSHLNHVHQNGWLSSVFYVKLPPAIFAEGQQGWLNFGAPGFDTRPVLEPDHVIQPAAGRLVLFPSYCWHGTNPFVGEGTRLTLAFDVVPIE